MVHQLVISTLPGQVQLGYAHKYGIRAGVRVFNISGFSTRRTIFMLMSNRASIFKQSDLTRSLNRVRAAGLQPARVVIDSAGTMEIILSGAGQGEGRAANPCDRLLGGGTK